MMKLLIVDDEQRAIQAVLQGMDWSRLDMLEVYTASNKEQAIAQIELQNIDLMLCDIEMPMGTGLELLEWVNQNSKEICCVFMTCHAEFSFVQQAMHLGSFDYVLKPLDFEKLELVLLRAVHRTMEKRHLVKTNSFWQNRHKDAAKQFWLDFFTGDIQPKRSSIAHFWQQWQIDFPLDGMFLPIYMSVREWKGNVSNEDRKLMLYALRNIADELLDFKESKREVLPFSGDTIFVILQVETGKPDERFTGKVANACDRIIAIADEHLNALVCGYIGVPDDIVSIPEQQEILQAMDFNNVILSQRLLNLGRYNMHGQEYSNNDIIVWEDLIMHGQHRKLLQEIQNTARLKSMNGTLDRQALNGLHRDFYFLLYEYTRKNHFFLDEMFQDEFSKSIIRDANRSLESFLLWVDYVLTRLDAHEHSLHSIDAPIEKAKRYIDNHLADALPVEDIAAHVHLNADYLNRIFKKNTGMVLSQYVTNQKIEKAKWLMKNTTETIGEIAAKMGYYNYSSFNRNFSKIVGISPQEYKRTQVP